MEIEELLVFEEEKQTKNAMNLTTQIEYLLMDIEEVSQQSCLVEKDQVKNYIAGNYDAQVHKMVLDYSHLCIPYREVDKELRKYTRRFNKEEGSQLYNQWFQDHQQHKYR